MNMLKFSLDPSHSKFANLYHTHVGNVSLALKAETFVDYFSNSNGACS